MATQIKRRRGDQTEIDGFTPAVAEIVVNTTKNEMVVGDGVTQGGFPAARKSNVVLSHATLADAIADVSLKVGYSVNVEEHTTGFKGSATWDVVLASAVTIDTIGVVACTGAPTLALVIRDVKNRTARQLGAVPLPDTGQSTRNSEIFQYMIDNSGPTRQLLYLGEGQYPYNTKLITVAGEEFTVVGVPGAPLQNGSDLPVSALVWTGGADSMVEVNTTFVTTIGFGVENRGTATDYLALRSASLGFMFKDMSWVGGSNHTQFTRAVIHSQGSRLGYAVFDHYRVQGPAPKFIFIEDGSTTGLTPILFKGRGFVETTNAGGDMTMFSLKNTTCDGLTIRDCTFNQPQNQLTIVDTTDTPTAVAIDVFTFENNEWDTASADAADRMFRLENIECFNFNKNVCNGGGSPTALGELVNTNITSCFGNVIKRVNGPVFNVDADCLFDIGLNALEPSNTNGWVPNTANGVIQVAYGVNPIIRGDLGSCSGSTTYNIDVTDAAGYQIVIETPPGGFMTPGQEVTIQVSNTTAGAISAGTFSSSFKTTGANVAPAAGKAVSYTFYYNGSFMMEKSRQTTGIDIT